MSIEGQGHFLTLAQGCVHTKIQTGFSQKLLCQSEPNCSSPEPKARGELIIYPWSGVRPSSSTISNMNISATSGPITMKFYQKHHLEGGKAALGFGPNWINTLVSMATDSSYRVIMEKTVLPLFLSCFSSNPFYTCR